jgi:hypothetical protein
VPEDGLVHTVATQNGVLVKAECITSGTAQMGLASAEGFSTLDAYGTVAIASSEEVFAIDETEVNEFGKSDSSTLHGVTLDVVARNTEAGPTFARFDLHIETASCKVRGMITPSGS